MSGSNHRAEIVRLYEEASPELRRVLSRKLGDPEAAEDVAQDAFERLCERVDGDRVEDLRKYFFTMANRLALNLLRRRRLETDPSVMARAGLFMDSSGADSAADPATIARHVERLALAKQALGSLPAKTRQVFLLHRFHGYTYRQIAHQLGLSRKAIEYHMNRAMGAVLAAVRGA